MKLKPVDHDTQFIYECPSCGAKHWKLLEEVTRPNPAIHCHCGTTTELEQLADVQVTAKTVTKKVKPKPAISKQEINRVSDLVKGQGFSSAETKQMLVIALSKNPKSYTELLRFTLAASKEVNGIKTAEV